jgi:alkylhydroperoxidase family enzyme
MNQFGDQVTANRRLPLVSNATMHPLLVGAAAKLPPFNVFRALANAPSLAKDFMQYFARLFEPLELDARTERLIVLLTGNLSGCEYVWRQNVVVARSLGVTTEQIAALQRGYRQATCFSAVQQAAFEFAHEAIEKVAVGNAAYESAARHFSARALTEILYVVGSYMFLSRLIRSGGVPLDERPAEVPADLFQ